jgi:hypothetical protein
VVVKPGEENVVDDMVKEIVKEVADKTKDHGFIATTRSTCSRCGQYRGVTLLGDKWICNECV